MLDLPLLESVIERTPLTVSPDISVIEAIALMNQKQDNQWESLNTNINRDRNSCILLVEVGKLIGIFTLTASERELNRIAIAEVMTRKLVTLKQESSQTILTALSLLHQHRIHYLSILDEKSYLQGINYRE
jgi:hypothetical protein